MIYLASPYTHEDPAVREERFEEVCKAAGSMMLDGLWVFSPIAHTHPIAVRSDLPLEFDYWKHYDEAMIAACDELVVLKLSGWEMSRGVKAEMDIAFRLHKPISYMEWPPR